jgi:hypothetical protein
VFNVVTETFAAPRSVVGLPTPDAFSHVRGEMSPAGAASTSTVGTGAPVAGARVAGVAAANAVVANAVVANAVVAAGVRVVNVRTRVNAVAFTAQPALGQLTPVDVTVRKHNTYMTRFIAGGGDAPGPHRWRVPV